MNLSNKKEINSVPLRRVQGFDFDGATYLSNNSLNIKQDFATIVKVKLESVITNQDLWSSYYVGDSINECALRIRSDNNVYATIGNDDLGRATANINVSNLLGTIVTFAIRRVSNKVTVLVNNILYESVDSIVDGVENQIDPVIGARHRFDYSNESFVFFCDIPFLEVLEIQDTLTDNQLLEFGNLAHFTDHSDYATFNKNAYYPLDYNTIDYSGNNNDGTVTGTEQYEIIERGIKSINDVEVLSKRGFKGDGVSYIATPNPFTNTRYFTSSVWIKRDVLNSAHTIIRDSSSLGGDLYGGIRLEITSTNKIRFVANFSQTNISYWLWSSNDTIDTELTHVSVVADAQTKTCIFYINGVVSNSVDYAELETSYHTTVFDHSNSSSFIGVYQSGSLTAFFVGVLYALKVFDSALTEAQIKEEMNGNVLPALGYWPLQEDTKDYSNNGNDGIVTGTEQYETVQNGLTDWQDPVLP